MSKVLIWFPSKKANKSDDLIWFQSNSKNAKKTDLIWFQSDLKNAKSVDLIPTRFDWRKLTRFLSEDAKV